MSKVLEGVSIVVFFGAEDGAGTNSVNHELVLFVYCVEGGDS